MKIRPSISNMNYADDTIDHSDFSNRKIQTVVKKLYR